MYNLYLYYKNEFMGRHEVMGDDIEKCFKAISYVLVKDGFKKNKTIYQQIETYTKFCDTILKQKKDCYKIRKSDLLLFLSCYIALVKFNEISYNDFIFMKIKRGGWVS